MRKILLGTAMCLSACASSHGPSIPVKPGHDMDYARRAVSACTADAKEGGNSAVAGGYVTGIILGGLILGPAVVGASQDNIRATGEVDAVDRCLEENGFERRDLTNAETLWLNNAYGSERERRLDHLVGGGTIETYTLTPVQ